MNVLIVGNGAREHAIAWKISQSPKVSSIYISPGNGGTSDVATNMPVLPYDIDGLLKLAIELEIDLTIIGPEIPLEAGIVDVFEAANLAVFGPKMNAARLESSKVFAKELFKKYGIPTANSETFTSSIKALDYLSDKEYPIVIKADGLAAGKGVTIATSLEEARVAIEDCLDHNLFGSAGHRVIIENYLVGKEVSVFAFTDGITLSEMVAACDYKRAYDLDMGPNTGGMGSFSPPPFWNEELATNIRTDIMEPTILAMAKEGSPYKGVLYAGVILTKDGPMVLEFNCRFGDPETQVILPRLETDLVDIALAVVDNKLHETPIIWTTDCCVGIVLASKGYPGEYYNGFTLNGLDQACLYGILFHAGTKMDPYNPGKLVTHGGRILTVVGKNKTMDAARNLAYQSIKCIDCDSTYYRNDIAASINI